MSHELPKCVGFRRRPDVDSLVTEDTQGVLRLSIDYNRVYHIGLSPH